MLRCGEGGGRGGAGAGIGRGSGPVPTPGSGDPDAKVWGRGAGGRGYGWDITALMGLGGEASCLLELATVMVGREGPVDACFHSTVTSFSFPACMHPSALQFGKASPARGCNSPCPPLSYCAPQFGKWFSEPGSWL